MVIGVVVPTRYYGFLYSLLYTSYLQHMTERIVVRVNIFKSSYTLNVLIRCIDYCYYYY